MNQNQRNQLRNAVQEMRRTLEDDLSKQLSATYGILAPDKAGLEDPITVLDEKRLPHLQGDTYLGEKRAIVVAALDDYRERRLANGGKVVTGYVKADLEDYLRACAFTLLNRFATLKLLEARGTMMPVLKGGKKAGGFQFFQAQARSILPLGDDGYRLYLELLLHEAVAAIPSLGDPSGKFDTVLPTEAAVLGLIEAMDELEDEIWQSDETLGWIFQYFTPEERRKQVRKESAAPRNSDELAFRNQFFTPSYVVQFLVQNTLGRIWLEMNPQTALANQWVYLVKQDPRVREYRDPRSLKIIDPACGSGHFLLYSFELLHAIYHEAYVHPELGETLRADYPDAAVFAKRVPELIVEKNLYGVDIDLRVVQISQVALYLKSKRLHKDAQPQRANIVCAQQLPGTKDHFTGFAESIAQKVKIAEVKRSLLEVYEEFVHADELGLLLRTNETLDRFSNRAPLYEGMSRDAITQGLERYVEEASANAEIAELMFGDGSRQALRLLELMALRYDVVLMNPPFGAAAANSKWLFEKLYPKTKNDLYAAFVERGLDLLVAGGRLGAITSRTGFFLKSFTKWREEVLLGMGHLEVVADLGYGVLDKAMVETAAYVIERQDYVNRTR